MALKLAFEKVILLHLLAQLCLGPYYALECTSHDTIKQPEPGNPG